MGSRRLRSMVGVSVVVLAAASSYIWTSRLPPDQGQTIRIGCSDCPPFSDESIGSAINQYSGEVLETAARHLKLPIRFVKVSDSSKKSLLAGEIDIWPRLTPEPEDQGDFFFSEPWVAMSYSLLSRRGWDPHPGARVSVGAGVLQRQMALRAVPGAILTGVVGATTLDDLCSGKVEAAFAESRVLSALQLNDRPASCAGVRFQLKPSKEAAVPGSIAARPGSAWAAKLLREEMGRMAADGSMASLHSKWFLITSTETGAFDPLRSAERDLTSVRLAAAGFAILVLLTMRQTCKLRKLSAKAQGASLLKTRFVANVSHELRTPLSGIMGLVDMLSDTRMTAHQTELLRLVRSTAGSLVQMTTDLLDVARVEAGQREIAKEPFELRGAVDEVCAIMAGRAAEKGIRLEAKLGQGLPRRVLGDETRLREILMNLLGNALRHTQKGEVRLDVVLDQATPFQWDIAFSVTDTGAGISQEDLWRLFEGLDGDHDPGENPMNRGGRLNIAIGNRLVNLLGGKMTAASPAWGGAQFRFVLPFEVSSSDPDPAGVIAAEPAAVAPPLRILVCENDQVNRKVAVHLLTKLAHSVEAVTNGIDAVAAAGRERFDLVLMDCHLPDIDGYEAARRIRAEGASAGAPIVAMTAAALAEDQRRCVEAGMTGFLAKPLSLAALSDTLSRVDMETRLGKVY